MNYSYVTSQTVNGIQLIKILNVPQNSTNKKLQLTLQKNKHSNSSVEGKIKISEYANKAIYNKNRYPCNCTEPQNTVIMSFILHCECHIKTIVELCLFPFNSTKYFFFTFLIYIMVHEMLLLKNTTFPTKNKPTYGYIKEKSYGSSKGRVKKTKSAALRMG